MKLIIGTLQYTGATNVPIQDLDCVLSTKCYEYFTNEKHSLSLSLMNRFYIMGTITNVFTSIKWEQYTFLITAFKAACVCVYVSLFLNGFSMNVAF